MISNHAGPADIAHLSPKQKAVFQKLAVKAMTRRLRRLEKSFAQNSILARMHRARLGTYRAKIGVS